MTDSRQRGNEMNSRLDFTRFRPEPEKRLDGTVIIPVNARADLETVLLPLEDLARYNGSQSFEVILVINNYEAESPPAEIEKFRDLGIQVVAVPDVRRQGEVVIVSARVAGVNAAKSEVTVHFDADCRIPDPTALLDWYFDTLRAKPGVAYTHVGYYELRRKLSVHFKVLVHNVSRWGKRRLLGIPTTRGSNYAVCKSVLLDLYKRGQISVDLQIGPAARLAGSHVSYSGQRQLTVFTSGRRFKGGWLKLFSYFLYRLRYNLNAIPTRQRAVTRDSWSGFDRETENRASM